MQKRWSECGRLLYLMSFALFDMLVLVSRMSNSFLGSFLAKRIADRGHRIGRMSARGSNVLPSRGFHE
jgi:hypothetical protein